MSGGGNPILTEPNDKRKRHDESNAKRMKYLIKENTQLKEQVKDLKTLLDLNRDALQCMTAGNKEKTSEPISKDGTFRDYPKGFHQETFSTLISRDQKGANDEWTGQDGPNLSKHLPVSAQTLVNSLIQENRKLAQMLELVIEERNTAQNKAYLNERIIQQNIEFEDEIVTEFKEKIEDLKMNIKTKEFILHEFECQRLIPAADEDKHDPKTFYVFKEVVTPMKVVRAANEEKKLIEEELIEERLANSKIRKDYKAVYDKAEHLAMELRKLRSVLSTKLSSRILMGDLQLDQYKGSKYALGKFLRRNSLDSKLSKMDPGQLEQKSSLVSISTHSHGMQQTLASPRKGQNYPHQAATHPSLEGVYSPRATIASAVDQYSKLGSLGAVNDE